MKDSALSGYVLDIVKCFNGLPRPPMRMLLERLGCPPDLAKCWVSTLNRLERSASFSRCISQPQLSSTGAPEGNPLSVPAIIAICWILHQVLAEFSVEAALFVDNWAWTCDDPALHTVALSETFHLIKALRLEVDWAKSFGWARDAESYKWWCDYGQSLMP